MSKALTDLPHLGAVEEIECWGPHGVGGCDAKFKGRWDEEHEAAGWGWTLSNSEAPEYFYACPNCKDNLNGDQNQ